MRAIIQRVNKASVSVNGIIKGQISSGVLIFLGIIYLLGVQGITISIHLPLNKHIQKIDINSTNSQTLSEVRKNFETKWNYFNNIRTSIALFVLLIFLLILTIR